MRIAAIDIGTNTVQLLIADAEAGSVRRVCAEERFVRLGEGVDASGQIGPAARDRLRSALQDHQDTVHAHDVDTVVAAGTSALRDAENRDAVLADLRETLGWEVEILSGDAEAAWSFAAACAPVAEELASCLVVDIGGGSTELIAGAHPHRHRPNFPDAIVDRVSLNLGCVRLTERYFDRQPPRPRAIAEAEQHIQAALSDMPLTVDPQAPLIGTAGTATALARVHAGPDSTGDALHGDGVTLPHSDVRHWRKRLLRLSVDDVRALHPEAMAGRADVFPVGILLLDHLLRHFDAPALRVSPFELRHGLILRTVARPT